MFLWTLRLQIVYPGKLMAFKVNQSIHPILLLKMSPGSHRWYINLIITLELFVHFVLFYKSTQMWQERVKVESGPINLS